MEQKIISNKLRVGSDFSGVGAFNQALMRLGLAYEEIFACDMDKYARQTFIANYGEPQYYPVNVYDRAIPEESLDIYMTSPPCQAFSLAGKRLGKDDQRGILFFNSLEFIQKNQPRYFIFENVKGLLSDDGGKTFSEWVNLLGGKSVNGNSVMFPYEESVPYHLYWKVLNAKDHGVPQNRERVFLIGIRDDIDNTFRWPIEEHLTKRLKDVLEEDVDDKYFLSEKMLDYLNTRSDNFNGGKINFRTENDYATTITKSSSSLDISDNIIKLESIELYNDKAEIIQLNDPKHSQQRVYSIDGISPTISAGSNGGGQNPSKHLTPNYRIRRLTPRECFRLMDFPNTFNWPVSDSQAYKQAGNSIVVNVLYKIIKNLRLLNI